MAEIPIIDGNKNVVSRINWVGGLFKGKGTVRSDRDHTEDAQRIRELIVQRKDLEKVQFRSRAAKGYTMGWRGFEGTLQALNVALPTIGFHVDWERVDWPVGSEKVEVEVVE